VTFQQTQKIGFRQTDWRFGWVAGAGGEWRLWDNWSIGVKYLHYDFGKSRSEEFQSFSGTNQEPFSTATTSKNLTVDVVRGEINFRWGGTAY
jgi:outer membrane immunogenic protein